MEYFVISAKFVPLKYYTLSSQLRRLTSFSVGLFGSANSVTRSYPVMRKLCISSVFRFKKKKKEDDRPTDPPYFQAERANKLNLLFSLGLTQQILILKIVQHQFYLHVIVFGIKGTIYLWVLESITFFARYVPHRFFKGSMEYFWVCFKA